MQRFDLRVVFESLERALSRALFQQLVCCSREHKQGGKSKHRNNVLVNINGIIV